MDFERFDAEIKVLSQRTPFEPFIVRLLNGDSYEVDRTDVFHYRDGTAFFIAKGGRPVFFNHENVTQFVGNFVADTAKNP